jgi:crotonobetainyl-CoA:carnitine CoA-transferase CaiB-like acyl-CoA transferase
MTKDVMISYLWPEGMMQYMVVGAEAAAADPNDRPDLVFKTSDGYITAGTISDSEWHGFRRASGDPELANDPRFATPAARSVNATARINKMAEYIIQHTTAEWLERLDAADVPCAPILRRGEIVHNEQVVARGHHRRIRPAFGRSGPAPQTGGSLRTQRGRHRRTGPESRAAFERGCGSSDTATAPSREWSPIAPCALPANEMNGSGEET